MNYLLKEPGTHPTKGYRLFDFRVFINQELFHPILRTPPHQSEMIVRSREKFEKD